MLRGSNPRPSPCKGDALPTELSTRKKPQVYGIFQEPTKRLAIFGGDRDVTRLLSAVVYSKCLKRLSTYALQRQQFPLGRMFDA